MYINEHPSSVPMRMPVHQGLQSYRPYAEVVAEGGAFEARVARNGDELLRALRLRSRVFGSEYAVDQPEGIWDFEQLDLMADHLILLKKDTQQVVGTYRLLPEQRARGFYSATEFELGEFTARPGAKLEMSRACIDPEYRTGGTLALLWKGVTRYVRSIGAQVIFGCSSVHTQCPREAASLIHRLTLDGAVDGTLSSVSPRREFRLNGLEEALIYAAPQAQVELPSLLALYIKAGARVAREPAHDTAFNCIDFFTVLDFSSLTKRFSRRFLRD